MNVLFYTHGKVYSIRGGTERTTITVASALKRYYGCRCYSVYEAPEDMPMEECFEEEYQWMAGNDKQKDIKLLRNIVTSKKIDFIIDQGIFINVRLLSEVVEGTSCKVILAHHFAPGAEVKYMSVSALLKSWKEKMSIRGRCRWVYSLLLFPYAKSLYVNKLRKSYKEGYDFSCRTILLSKGFVEEYQRFGQFKDDRKFYIIPNGLSFNGFISEDELDRKKNVVLVVSRMDETHKRLSLVLKIWEKVKKHADSKGWVLKMVGIGRDLDLYIEMVRACNIPDVMFVGRQNPLPFYKEASVFLLSSSNMEAWGLTLTEAQQMGVVPIAFDTYAALHDIITDGKDGFIIREGDLESYEEKLLQLMKDTGMRQAVARNGLTSCRRFSHERIAEYWWNLLNLL